MLARILDTCVNGFTLSDPEPEDMPIVHANTAFDPNLGLPAGRDRKSGEMFLHRLSIRPLVDRNGRLINHLGVQYDVTAQVGANAEIDRLRLQLGDAQR